MKHTLIYTADKSNKFWSIEVEGCQFTVVYGKVGTDGQTQIKEFASEAECQKAAEKLIAEKIKKGYVEQVASAEPSLDGVEGAITLSSSKLANVGLKIPKYKESDEADLEANEFVVNLKNPASIASALKYQIDNVDDFLERLADLSSSGEPCVSFGAIEDGEFTPFGAMDVFTSKGLYYDEEILADHIERYPELYPLLAEYIEKVVIRASSEESSSGPWASEETIFGQFLVPMLAEKDSRYEPLLQTFAKTNVEIRYSPGFQQLFDYVDVGENDGDEEGDDDGAMELDVSNAIFDADAIRKIADSLIAASGKHKKAAEQLLAKRNDFKYALLGEAHNGVEVIYCNSIDPLILDESIIVCSIDFVHKVAHLSYKGERIEDIDLSDKFLKGVQKFVESHGRSWCTANSNNHVVVVPDAELGNINIAQCIADLRARPSTNEFVTQNHGVEMVQWYNNRAIADFVEAFFKSQKLSDDELAVFSQFVGRISTCTTVYLQKMAGALSANCINQTGDFFFQVFAATYENMECVSINTKGSIMYRYNVAREFQKHVQALLHEFNENASLNKIS